MRIPAASSTGTSLRSGTRPAHMRIPSADSIRSPRGAYAPRSWLHGAGSPEKRTAAVRTEFRCKKRHSRCVNAGSKERRASARRGFSNRICKCNPMNFGVSSSYAECAPRGAYAPRSWRRYNERPQEERRFLRCTNERSQERRTSARRGKRIVMAKEVRVLAAIERPQERRASARRGFPNRICKCNAMNFGASSSRAECIPRGAYAPRSWLHARHIACDMRFRFATADVLHGGLTPPAPGCTVPARRRKRQRQCVPSFSAKNDIRAAQTHIRSSAACVSRRQLKPANCLQYHRRFSVMVAGRLSSTVMGS